MDLVDLLLFLTELLLELGFELLDGGFELGVIGTALFDYFVLELLEGLVVLLLLDFVLLALLVEFSLPLLLFFEELEGLLLGLVLDGAASATGAHVGLGLQEVEESLQDLHHLRSGLRVNDALLPQAEI